jgi:hypothetical protein
LNWYLLGSYGAKKHGRETCRVSFILPGQLILLAFLVETNIFEASHVTFFNTN